MTARPNLGAPFQTTHLVSGKWIAPSYGNGTRLTVNGEYFGLPLYVPAPFTMSALGAFVATAGSVGALVRLGLYVFNADLTLLSLVVDAGTVAATSSSTAVTIAASAALVPGYYVPVLASQGAPATPATMRGGQRSDTCLRIALNPAPDASGDSLAWGAGGGPGTMTGAMPPTLTPAAVANSVVVGVKVT